MKRARNANDLRASICPIRPTYDVATRSLPRSTREMGHTFELGRTTRAMRYGLVVVDCVDISRRSITFC
jgi:hypothetical protein